MIPDPDKAKVVLALHTMGYSEKVLPPNVEALDERQKKLWTISHPRRLEDDDTWSKEVNSAHDLLVKIFPLLRSLLQGETTTTDDSTTSRERPPTHRRTDTGGKQQHASQTGRSSSSSWHGAEDLGENEPPRSSSSRWREAEGLHDDKPPPPTLQPSVVDFGEIPPERPLPSPRIVHIRGHVTPLPRVRAQPNFGRWWSLTVRTDQPARGELGQLTVKITDPMPLDRGPHTDTTTIWVGDVSLVLTIRCKVAASRPDAQSHDDDIPSSSSGSRDNKRTQIAAERDALVRRRRHLPDSNFTIGGFILGSLALFLALFFGLLEILYAVDIYRPANDDYGHSFVLMLVGSPALMSVIALVRAIAVERRRSLEREISVRQGQLKELE